MDSNNTHHPEDLGYKNGLEKALKALRQERFTAWDKAELHEFRMNSTSGEARKYNSDHYEYYCGMSEALTEVISVVKDKIKNA